MSGIYGPCDRDCQMGRAHEIECHNYIELGPCVVCSTIDGWHQEGCVMERYPTMKKGKTL